MRFTFQAFAIHNQILNIEVSQMAVSRTCKEKNLSTLLKLSQGEFILYELTVEGAHGVFALVDESDVMIFSHADWPTPQSNYQRNWPKNAGEVPQQGEVFHTMGLHFITAVKYDYRVSRRAKDGSLLELIKDCTFQSQDPRDDFFEPLHIFVQ